MQLVYVLTKSDKATVFTQHQKTWEARNLVDQSSTEFSKTGNRNVLASKIKGV